MTEVSEGSLIIFDIDDRRIMVTKASGLYIITDRLCTHEEADLSLGVLAGETITCPLHQAKFELTTGKVLEGPNGEDPESIGNLRTYSPRVINDELWCDL